jgi:hypothetical protein
LKAELPDNLERIYARKSKNKNTHFKPNMAVNM